VSLKSFFTASYKKLHLNIFKVTFYMCVNSQQILFISADTDRLLSSQDISLGHPHSSFFSLDRI